MVHLQSLGGIDLKFHPAVEFTINLFSYILFVLVLSCSFLKKERKTSAHGRTSRSLLLLVNCLAGNITRPSLACRCKPFCRQQGAADRTSYGIFWKNIIAVLCLDVPRTMACCRQSSPLCCLRCRFAFSDGLPFAINSHRRVSRILSRTIVMSKKHRHR
jgi:hypothetical protein